MNVEDIRKQVDYFTTNNIPYMIYMDNEIMVDTREQHSALVFDDTEEVLLVIRPSQDFHTQQKRPIDFEYFGYENIQCIKGKLTDKEALAKMLEMKNANKLSEEQYNTIVQSINDLVKPYKATNHVYL